MTRVIFCGQQKIRIPDGWTEWLWHDRRYRIVANHVEVFDRTRQAWLPSIRLATSAPKGRSST